MSMKLTCGEFVGLAYASEDELREFTEEILDENAKLRELAHAMTYCMTGRCLQCPMCAPFDTSIGGAPECRASWKLRELGIEDE